MDGYTVTLKLVNMSLDKDHNWRVIFDISHLLKDSDTNTKISPFIVYNVQSKEDSGDQCTTSLAFSLEPETGAMKTYRSIQIVSKTSFVRLKVWRIRVT